MFSYHLSIQTNTPVCKERRKKRTTDIKNSFQSSLAKENSNMLNTAAAAAPNKSSLIIPLANNRTENCSVQPKTTRSWSCLNDLKLFFNMYTSTHTLTPGPRVDAGPTISAFSHTPFDPSAVVSREWVLHIIEVALFCC